MGSGSIEVLFEKLLLGEIEEKEYASLFVYVSRVVERTAQKLSYELQKKEGLETQPISILGAIGRFLPEGEDSVNFVTEELILHILKKKRLLLEVLKDGNFKAYFGVMVKSFIVDIYRKLTRGIETLNPNDSQEEETEEERALYRANPQSYKSQILAYELIELKELILDSLGEEEIKYLCYSKDSKRYKCLWGSKSEDAIYQDVRRKGKKVLEKFRTILIEAEVSKELLEELSKSWLSDMCEELRLEKCRGETDETP